MPRKYKVESKFKNPDKYIDVLKKQNEEAWENSRATFKELLLVQGKHWFNYKKGKTLGANPGDLETARQCRIGDSVIMHGEVISIKRDDIHFELSEVRIRERGEG